MRELVRRLETLDPATPIRLDTMRDNARFLNAETLLAEHPFGSDPN
jgi:hypothetical protein